MKKKEHIPTYLKPLLFHKKPLEIVEYFRKNVNGKINKKSLLATDLNSKLIHNNKGYKLTFSLNRPITSNLVGEVIKKVEFIEKKDTFIIDSLFLNSTNLDGDYEGAINAFYSKGFTVKQAYYHRLIIPLEKEIAFHFNLEDCTFNTDLGYVSRTGVKALINSETIYANVIHQGSPKRYYLSIESQLKQTFEEFSDKAFAVQKGIGYLCGHLAGGEGYFFVYSKQKMEIPKYYGYHDIRPPIRSIYTPLHTNPYGYLDKKKNLAEKYYKNKTLQPVSFHQFSILCQRLYDSLEFSSAILLMLESCLATLLFMPGGFAIVLENLSDIIMADDKLKLAPIKDKNLSKTIRKECTDVVQKYSASISSEDLKVLLGRIEQINQTTNKERLRAPFKKLGISLLPEDIKVLESRNDFLHGRVPDFTNEGATRSLDRINQDLYYASMRFYTLLNMLILKWIGFDNYVLNHPKIREIQCGIKLKEDYYRKL
ncbi:hypothetical protein [Taibaiella helva]|uniref:hypothetical protein n=1 Tax=Taibaiella helva TaxID=2301235 RepID=UPI000E57E20B|nr:hypothetical protein [Taibaiella helva]